MRSSYSHRQFDTTNAWWYFSGIILRKLALTFTIAALAVASAETYRVTFFQSSAVQGQELKPGEYRLEIKDHKVVIGAGAKAVRADVKIVNSDKKFDTTLVRYARAGDQMTIQEIRIGGTKTRLVFGE